MSTSTKPKSLNCVIVGAGLAGLAAGSRLQQAGVDVKIIEREPQAGGRLMAITLETDRGQAVFDAGAQFFTVREPEFESLVEHWLSRGLVEIWSRGFATADGSYYADGYPRYRGIPDMAAIARDLAEGLDVSYGQSVQAISFDGGKWQISVQESASLSAEALVLTPPVPQSLTLLSAGAFNLQSKLETTLKRIRYTPCLAWCALLEDAGNVPEPGGMWPVGSPVDWLADNHRKGVSPVPGAITVHAGPDLSKEYWQADDRVAANRLLEEIDQWLGDPVRISHLKRWQYSKPEWMYPERCLSVDGPAPLIFAGDAFGGPRVEGATLSGLAAAEWLLSH